MAPLLRTGLIGNPELNGQYPAALQILADIAGTALEFNFIDTRRNTRLDFGATIRQCKKKHWAGIAMGGSWKPVAARFSGHAMDPEYLNIGAINLLSFIPNIRGHSTDFSGFQNAYKCAFGPEFSPGKVMMAGAGGIARAIGAALISQGVEELLIWDSHPLRAEALCETLGPLAQPSGLQENRAFDGLVNTLPQDQNNAPFSSHNAIWAFDANANDTPFLGMASDRGAQVFGGLDLFFHTTIDSFETLTGADLDRNLALKKLAELTFE